MLALLEEGLWDIAVFRDHPAFFGVFYDDQVAPHSALTWLVPLLSLPQLTHYVLDGIIWKKGFQLN